MKEASEMLYTESHEWISVEADGTCFFGITDYAQEALGDIVFVQLPDIGAQAVKGAIITDVESVKAVADVYSPVNGEVVAANTALEDAPDTINTAPYSAWIAQIKADALDTSRYMNADQYATFVKGL